MLFYEKEIVENWTESVTWVLYVSTTPPPPQKKKIEL